MLHVMKRQIGDGHFPQCPPPQQCVPGRAALPSPPNDVTLHFPATSHRGADRLPSILNFLAHWKTSLAQSGVVKPSWPRRKSCPCPRSVGLQENGRSTLGWERPLLHTLCLVWTGEPLCPLLSWRNLFLCSSNPGKNIIRCSLEKFRKKHP